MRERSCSRNVEIYVFVYPLKFFKMLECDKYIEWNAIQHGTLIKPGGGVE